MSKMTDERIIVFNNEKYIVLEETFSNPNDQHPHLLLRSLETGEEIVVRFVL